MPVGRESVWETVNEEGEPRMTRISADKYGRGKLAHPRVSAKSAVFVSRLKPASSVVVSTCLRLQAAPDLSRLSWFSYYSSIVQF
jgi:hypothetical protein